MTNDEMRQLLQDAEVELRQTTVGYINKHWQTPPAGSRWANGLTNIDKVIAALQPTPPPAGTLPWRPAGYTGGDPSNPQNFPGYKAIHLSNALSGQVQGNGGDVYLICDEQLRNKEVQIIGARHVVSLGLDSVWDFMASTEHRCLKLIGCTGVVHIEGANIGAVNDGLLDAIVWGGNANSGAPGQIGQLQNVRIDYVHNDSGGHHCDGTQLQVGTWLAGLRMYQNTYKCRYSSIGDAHGLFAKQESSSDHIRGVDIRRCNFVGFDHSLWQDVADIDFHTEEVYVQNPQRQTLTYPQPGQPIGPRLATITNNVITFANTNWTGSVKVEQTQQTPDFCPAGSVGRGYKSPGYM